MPLADGEGPEEPVDVLVSTFNSARTLAACLASAREHLPVHRLIVVDHRSTDGTAEIARRHGAEVHPEEVGLGYSRSLALSLASTRLVVFLDSDVTLLRGDFVREARRQFGDPRVGAVVGMSTGHRFCYGLPFSLAVLPRVWAQGIRIPPQVNARETYYFQERLRKDGLRVGYVLDAMVHRSGYRAHKPEWEGANTRIVAGWDPRQLAYALAVSLLIQMNSRRAKNILYTPIFYAKFLRGFLQPARWRVLDRRTERE
ncbi:MAG: glycosyltransferase family 2 protein [Thermoplasmata archaeon]|nr:glycosyltransferase family 2 protein [Thermoplasmata archaeon]